MTAFTRTPVTRPEFVKKLDPTHQGGQAILEIGPFDRPVFRGENVKYFDILSSDEIAEACNKLDVKAENIPHIHYVQRNVALGQIPDTFDACFSSHCIEHTLDAFGHINDIGSLLREGGKYYLAIPDKRYCFDHFRPPSTIGSLVQAAEDKPTDHTLALWLDRSFTTAHNDAARHWRGDHGELPKSIPVEVVSSALQKYKDGFRPPMNPHIWQFTPETFLENMEVGRKLGYLNMVVSEVYSTREGANEFYAVFEKP